MTMTARALLRTGAVVFQERSSGERNRALTRQRGMRNIVPAGQINCELQIANCKLKLEIIIIRGVAAP